MVYRLVVDRAIMRRVSSNAYTDAATRFPLMVLRDHVAAAAARITE